MRCDRILNARNETFDLPIHDRVAVGGLTNIDVVGVDRDRPDPGQAGIGRRCIDNPHSLGRAGFEEDQASDTCVVYPVSVAVVEMAQVGTVALEVLDRARCPVEDSQRIDESGQARASERFSS